MKLSQMPKEADLQKMNMSQIKAHIREFNDHYAIRGYSKLNKSQLISAVLTAQKRIANAGGPALPVKFPTSKKSGGAKKAPAKKATPKPATPKPATPKPATPKPATPKPATPKKATPKPATPDLTAPTDKATDYIMKELYGEPTGFGDFRIDGDVGRVVMNLSPKLMSAKNGRLRYTSLGEDVAKNMAFMNDKQKAKMKIEVEKILQQNKKQQTLGSPYDQFLTTPNRSRWSNLIGANGLPANAYLLGDEIAEDPSIRDKFLDKSPTPFSEMIKKLANLLVSLPSSAKPATPKPATPKPATPPSTKQVKATKSQVEEIEELLKKKPIKLTKEQKEL